MKKSRHIVIASDQHSGHIIGLTPPRWIKTAKKKLANYEARLWKLYKELLRELPPIDHAIINGDLVDGKQNKTKGLELLTISAKEQCEMATQSIVMLGAKTIEIIRGTRYHVGQDENYEDQVLPMLREHGYKSRELGIQDHGYFDINGVVLDVKHKISNAKLPHTKGTPLGREKLQNLLWYEHGETPLAKVIVRSHVHNFCHLSGWNGRLGEWHSITTPALQGLGESYGDRECSQTVDWGLILIEITPQGNVRIDPLIRLTRHPEELVKKL